MTTDPRALLERLVLLLVLLVGCRSPAPGASPPASDGPSDGSAEAEIRAVLVRLYDAFGFEAGGQPDWETQRRLALPGASFVPSLRADRAPVATGIEPFLADFRAFVVAEPWSSTGLRERIVGLRIESFGALAHAWVAFEGYEPQSGRVVTRGLDSIPLVHDRDGAWKLAAFATQFENDELRLPRRFLDAR